MDITVDPGWNEPRTRTAWNRALKKLVLIGAVGVIAMTVAIALIVAAERRADQLRAKSVKIEAVILEDREPGVKCVQQSVPIGFELNGTAHQASVSEGCGSFTAGETLTVFVDPNRPTRVITSGGNDDSRALVFIELVGVVVGLWGLMWAAVGYARLRRARSVLRKTGWTRRKACGYDLTLRWARDLGVVVLVDGPEPELYVLGWAPLVGVPRRDEGPIEFAVLGGGEGVVARDLDGTPRPVRRLREGRLYRKALTAHAAATHKSAK